ncbi:MAG: iron ABC transporter permease [Chloroflexota bacterium]
MRRFALFAGATGALLVAVSLLSLMWGAVDFTPAEAVAGLWPGGDAFSRTIVWEIRFPRVLTAVVVGASLAVSGTLLQVVTRNPLADPTILGISSGAGLGTALVLAISPGAAVTVLVGVGAAGGIAGASIILFLAWQGEVSSIRLTLAGVALSAFFGAIIVALLSSSRTFVELGLGFLAGGLYGSGWADARASAPLMLPGVLLSFALAGRLNALALGDDMAAGLGVMADRTRALTLTLAGALAGVAVALAGLVSFVGLVSPHLARFAVGDDHRYLIPASALTGALLVVAADLVARLVIQPSELPMGIFTAAVGAPFLLYLLRFRA